MGNIFPSGGRPTRNSESQDQFFTAEIKKQQKLIMKIFKFLTILALGTNALSEREQRRQARREEIERDGELGEEDAKVSKHPIF